jgi:hypothetical protein
MLVETELSNKTYDRLKAIVNATGKDFDDILDDIVKEGVASTYQKQFSPSRDTVANDK